jgi:hypothetical protein
MLSTTALEVLFIDTGCFPDFFFIDPVSIIPREALLLTTVNNPFPRGRRRQHKAGDRHGRQQFRFRNSTLTHLSHDATNLQSSAMRFSTKLRWFSTKYGSVMAFMVKKAIDSPSNSVSVFLNLYSVEKLRVFPVGRHFNKQGERVHSPRPLCGNRMGKVCIRACLTLNISFIKHLGKVRQEYDKNNTRRRMVPDAADSKPRLSIGGGGFRQCNRYGTLSRGLAGHAPC